MTVPQKSEREGHPYPFRIGFRAMERLQAALFYTIFQDEAAGMQVRRKGGVKEVSKALRKEGLSKEVEDNAWDYMSKHKSELKEIPFQNVVLQMFAIWDWYAGKMKSFVSHGLKELGEFPELTGRLKGQWKSFSRQRIELQVTILPDVAGATLELADSTPNALKELRLVRNLGVHNLWRVDEEYQRFTATGPWELDELRKLSVGELLDWQAGLNDAIKTTTVAMSKRFVDVEGPS